MNEELYHAREEAEFLDRVGDPTAFTREIPDYTELPEQLYRWREKEIMWWFKQETYNEN